MPRQTITFTTPNEKWLSSQVVSEEYSSKSEVVNDLIRRERQRQERITEIRMKLIRGEQSGISKLGKEELRKDIKAGLKPNG